MWSREHITLKLQVSENNTFQIHILSLRYKIEVAGKSLPVLTTLDKGRYGVIVFESLSKYANMDKWNRELLDKYCREYSVGVVGFATPSEETLVGAQLKGFPLFMHTNLRLKVSWDVIGHVFQLSIPFELYKVLTEQQLLKRGLSIGIFLLRINFFSKSGHLMVNYWW